MFFVCLSVFFVTLWNDDICDNGNAMKQCNFHNYYGAIAYRKFCSCAPSQLFLWTPEFSLRGKFVPKITIFHPHFLSHNGEIWRKGTDLGLLFRCQMW